MPQVSEDGKNDKLTLRPNMKYSDGTAIKASDFACGNRSRHDRRRTVLEVTDLVKHFPIKSRVIVDRVVGRVRAVDGVSLVLHEGETLGSSASRVAANRLCAGRFCS
jgi:ABC-type glutathione transport system ATPase component